MSDNRPFATLSPGDTASVTRECTVHELVVFAHASGNLNPLHLPDHDGDGVGAAPNAATAPSMWIAALFSSVIGGQLPGPGSTLTEHAMTFDRPVRVGDRVTAQATVVSLGPEPLVHLELEARTEDGERVARGEARVRAPTEAMAADPDDLPPMLLHSHEKFDAMVEACAGLEPLATAVVAPHEPRSLAGAALAAERGLIRPILVGDPDAIRAAAREADVDIAGMTLHPVADAHDAPAAAAELARIGEARALMKGHVHTDELLRAVVDRSADLRTGRRLTHVFVMDVPGREGLVFVSDAAINIAPDLAAKRDIIQNAIDLARSLGVTTPRVGVLSAVETVTEKIPSTLDAAILAKMADRGQITGGLVDGPLAMDNAVDVHAARTKGVTSLVAGRADILVPPNLEAANMLAKELTFIAQAEAAGLVIGARVPVMLTSRADGPRARMGSCALALLFDDWRRTGVSRLENAPWSAPAEAAPA